MDQTILDINVNQEKILQELAALRKESNALNIAINEVHHQIDDLCQFIEKL